jgi:hypothetical protein
VQGADARERPEAVLFWDVQSQSVQAFTPEIEGAVIRQLIQRPDGFRYFLPHWRFTNRDSGTIGSFSRIWPGQASLVEAMGAHDWLFVLKAGKLGFSELECAYDAWVALTRKNARVHLFSRNLLASRELLSWVRFGLEHLPPWLKLPVLEGQAGADNSTSLKLYGGPDDVRTIISYPATQYVAIDAVATHSHLDEFARMAGGGEQVWQSVATTVSPENGTLHIVTRGAGPNYAARLWRQAMEGSSQLHPFFAAYDQRPGREGDWYGQQESQLTTAGVWQFAPRTWQEALQGDASYVYPMFDRPSGRHVTPDPCPPGDCKRLAVGIDLGTVTPTAMLLVGERTSGRRHVYAEFYRPGVGIDDVEEQLFQWRAHGPIRIFSPPDEKLLTATLIAHGFDARKAHTDIDMGIQSITRHLNGDGLTVNPRCENMINEVYDYRASTVTDQSTKVQYAGQRPVKHHADAMDAWRYAVLGLDMWEEDLVEVTLPSGVRVWQ